MKRLSIMMACAIFAGTLLAEIGITPPTGHFDRSGGPGAITTTGNGTWTANSPDRWISVKTVSGTAGYAVAYTVEENRGVEMRTGHVYVSGNTHTVVQSGVGASLDKYSAEFENGGGSGYVTVSAEPGSGWTAKSNVSWIQVYTTSGTGTQEIRFGVSRYNEVSTRSGTLTIADNIFTVTQTGPRMKLASSSASLDYLQTTVRVRVNALADTVWSVEEDAGWLSVADAGPGEGGGIVVLAVEENASYSERNATVRIGTEVFSVRQLGRTDLVFKISTNEFSAAAAGASGERVAVTATPDLGWSAASDSDWIQLYPDYKAGSGNGSVAYKITPNTSLYPRMGTITITAVDKRVAAKRVDVSQEAAVATLTIDGYEFAAEGGSVNVGVSTEAGVGWTVSNPNSWITISDIPVAGPATLKLAAQAHTSVSPRSGTITIAGHEFAVSQRGRGVTLDCVAKAFGTDGKPQDKAVENVIHVTTSSDVEWEAVASDATWIVIYEGKTGKGNGAVKYVVASYIGAGEPREGTITIGDQTVHIIQRPYELSIDPMGEWVTGNSGEGEIQVSLDIAGVWDAIATASWIIIDKITRDPVTGNGKVLFHYADNNTGLTRTGKIVVSGVEYTLTQQARQNVVINVETEGHGGLVSGGGTYNIGDRVTLAAIVQDGYAFDGWTLPGGGASMETALEVVASAAQTYKAKFVPLAPLLRIASESLHGVLLEWTNIPWAANYCVWRGVPSSRDGATKIATVTNDGTCRYLDGEGAENQGYWYWVEAVGAEDNTWSGAMQGMRARKTFAVSYLNLRGASHSNPQSYTEGDVVRFSPPGDIPGYTFEGWSPESVMAETTGDISVTAIWRQNEYLVKFDSNRGTGEMQDERFMHGFWRNLSPLAFSCDDCAFLGWSVVRDGEAVYGDEQPVKSLSAVDGDVISLYASWKGVLKGLSIVGECTEFYASESRPFSAVLRYSNGITREIVPTWSISSGTAYASVDGVRGLVTGVPYDNTTHVVTLKASYSEDGVTVTAERALTIKPCVSVSDAAGNGTISFSQDGDAAWVGQMDVSHDGTASLRTGVLDADERCGLGTSVTGPGTLLFWWRTSGKGVFSFALDGEAQAQTMSNGWCNVSIELLTNKVYDLSWQYVQGADSDRESDFGWLDEVEWVPAPERVNISFDTTGGAEIPDREYATGASLGNLPVAVRTGYAFEGWTVQPTDQATSVLVAESDYAPLHDSWFYAIWTANDYEISFVPAGGIGTMPNVAATYDVALAIPDCTFTRIGYAFAGWSLDAGGAVIAFENGAVVSNLTSVAGNVASLYAVWEANRYAVSFNANGGDGEMYDVELTYDTPQNLPKVGFSRTGHTFAGWALSSGGDMVFSDGMSVSNLTSEVNGTVILYAQWKVNQCTVTFNANGGTGGKTVTQDYGTALAAPAVSRAGYTFTGWSPSVPSTVPAGSATYTAQWKVNQYTMTFNANGGTGGKTVTQDYGTALAAPAVSRTGYTFNGWSPSVPSTVPAGNATYAAQWKVNQYTVTFNANGGAGGKTVTQDYGTALAAPTVSRTGYTFNGWSPSVPATVPAGNATYTAQWKVNQYTVTFNANGGTGGKAVAQNYGTALSAPTVTRTGYTFNGWSPSVPATMPAGNATYVAQWKGNQYTVTFNANGGTGVMPSQSFVYGKEQALSPVSFAFADHRFLGWAREPKGDVVYVDKAIVSNLTVAAGGTVVLHAAWEVWTTHMQVCYDAFVGAGIVTLDESDNIVVTLTNDVSGTVEIPDNVGTVIIDLNGHDIVGDGGLGETALPDGPAIRIVKGDGEGAVVTQLAIVDTSDGEKGQVAGGGEKAGIEIADGVAYNISVEVGDAVSVLNGDGTEQDCSSLGRGSLPWPDDGAYNQFVANVYDGYVLDGDGALAGIVQIKSAKQAVKSVTDKVMKVKTATTNVAVTATVTDAAGKKWSYKGNGTVDGVVTGLVCTTKGVLVPSFGVALGANGLEGERGGFLVAGARNGMGTKGDAMMAMLDANYKKSWTVALTNGLGVTHLQLVVGAKGSTKISGVTPDAFKISATVQGVMGDNAFFVPYLATLKNGKLTRPANLLLTLGKDGAVDVRTSNLGALKAGGPTTDEIEVLPYAESASSKGGEAYAGAVVLNDLAYPAKFAAKGLPAGLKIDAATGAITGTPTKPGRYTATITVTSGVNSKKKVETVVVFDIGNYTDAAIPVADLYGAYRVGVMVYEPIDSVAGCAVSGLPSGLKFATKETKDAAFGIVSAGTIYGVPTKAGEYTVYFKKSEKVNGKSVNHQASATFKVDALPAWAQGTFNGAVFGGVGWDGTPAGLVQNLSVGVNGKMSGKLVDADGLTWTLSANAYDAYDAATETYIATVVGKSGKLSVTNAMSVVAETVENPNGNDHVRGVATGDDWGAKQDCWKQEPWKTLAKAFAKAPQVTTTDGVSIKFAATGTIAAKGVFTTGFDAKTGKPIVYSGSCSSVLIPEGDSQYVAFVYFPPVAKKFGGYAAAIRLVWNGSSFSFLP